MASPDASLKVGVIGCGNISAIYLKNCRERFPQIEIVGVADKLPDRARARADEYGIEARSVDDLLGDPEIALVLNLTIPNVHAAVGQRILNAGKHVYGEKPLAARLTDGSDLLRTAAARRLRIGSAPDTFLGGGLQTCRGIIDAGLIGEPIAATAFMAGHGHESWHPDPEFYYKRGGGPMFDMGPYYLTALVSLLGPTRRVSGSTRITFPTRTITSEPKRGETIEVEVPTHVAGTLEFANGAIASIVMSFDVWGHSLPFIEVYGSEGSLRVPDPNTFGGPVYLRRSGSKEWEERELTHGNTDNSRGIGLADMIDGLLAEHPHRASGEMALHVLEIMEGIHTSSDQGRHYEMTSSCSRPEPLPASE